MPASAIPYRAISKREGRFNVIDYGARGDGATNDSPAFQAAADAAIAVGGTLVIPSPPDTYSLFDTIVLRPPSGRPEFFMDIEGSGESDQIQWFGSNNSAVFDVMGWKHSEVRGVGIRHQTGKTGIVFWELDGTAALYSSLSGVTWTGCTISGNGGTGNIGWRIGHTEATGSVDFSFMAWINCRVAYASLASGTYAYVNEGGNSLNHLWFGGWINRCDKGISNVASPGAAYTTGGAPNMFVYGVGMGTNNIDYELRTRGSYVIHGGRYELGKRFLTLGPATGQSGADLYMSGVEIIAYTPDDEILFDCYGGSSLVMDSCTVRPLSSEPEHTVNMIRLNGNSASRGYVALRGCKLRAADPFHTVSAGRWLVERDGSRHMTNTLSTDYFYRTRIRTVPGSYPYTALVTDRLIAVNTSSARTINLPACADARDSAEIIVKDATGSAGTNNITIDAAGSETIDGALTRVINTNYGSVRLLCDGVSNWLVT